MSLSLFNSDDYRSQFNALFWQDAQKVDPLEHQEKLGFLSNIVLAPAATLATNWWDAVLGTSKNNPLPKTKIKQLEVILDEISTQLLEGRFNPFENVEESERFEHLAAWCRGFTKALHLCPRAWYKRYKTNPALEQSIQKIRELTTQSTQGHYSKSEEIAISYQLSDILDELLSNIPLEEPDEELQH